MPKAGTFGQPQNDTDIQLDTSHETPKVSTQQHPSEGSVKLLAQAPLCMCSHAQSCQGELPLATALLVPKPMLQRPGWVPSINSPRPSSQEPRHSL